MAKSKIKIKGILFFCILFIASNSIVHIVNAAPPEDGPWDISVAGGLMYSSKTYNVYYPINIFGTGTITFNSCVFNMLNETDNVYIQISGNVIVNFIGCEFIGLEAGNSYIQSISETTTLNLDSCKLTNLGTIAKAAIETYSRYVQISNTNFTGQYCSIRGYSVSGSEYFKVQHNSISDGGSGSMRFAIEVNQRSDTIISNNTIRGFSRGIMMLNAEQYTTVYNNTFIGQTISGIEIYSTAVSMYAGLNVSKNNVSGPSSGIFINNGQHSNITGNRIQASSVGLNLNNGLNQTIENNIIEVGGSPTTDFNAIRLQNENMLKLLGNNFTSPNMNVPATLSMFEILGTYLGIVQMDRNYYNGALSLLIANIFDYSFQRDFIFDDVGNLYVYKCTGIKLHNLTLFNKGSLILDKCNDITVDNFLITDPKDQIQMLGSVNCTINNTSIAQNQDISWPLVKITQSSNCTVLNTNFTTPAYTDKFTALSVQNSNFTTIGFCQFDSFNEAIFLNKANKTLINNCTFIGNYPLSIGQGCLDTNFTFNECIKSDSATDLLYYIVFDEPTYSLTNIFNQNHWSHYFNANDTDNDGYADNPFKVGERGAISIYDNQPLFVDSDVDGLDSFQEIYYYMTDPSNPDTDGDLILDGEEVKIGLDGYITNPLNPDTDADGLTDFEEISGSYGYATNPLITDTDHDRFSDYYELIVALTDPTDYNNYPGGPIDDSNTDLNNEQEEEQEENTIGTIGGFTNFLIISMGLIGIYVYLFQRKYKGGKNLAA